MGGDLARFRAQRLGDFQGAFVEQLHGVLGRTHHRVHPGIGRVLVAAHEKRRASGLDLLDHLPVLHINHADQPFLEIGRGHDRTVLIRPGNPGTEMRHTGQRQIGHFAPHVEIHHLATGNGLTAAIGGPRRAQYVGVILAEKEIIENGVEPGHPGRPHPRQGNRFAHLVIVDIALEHRLSLGVVAQLPDFGDVLERSHEALARRGVVHRRHPRTLAGFVDHRNDPVEAQIRRVQQHQGLRQVIGRHHPLPVTGHREIAGVNAGADFRCRLQVVNIELADPAVAGGEKHIAPVRRELWSAVQREPAGKAVNRLELVAVENGDVMIARLHDHKKVEWIGAELRFGG